MPVSLQLTDVTGLLHGDADAYRNVLDLAHSVAWHEGRRKGISDAGDIAMDALLEGAQAVQSGKCSSPEELERIVKRTVWREAQRSYRRSLKVADLSIESLEVLAGPSLEGDDAITDQSEPPQASLLYTDARTQREDALARVDIVAVDKELIAYLNAHPEKMYELNPRRFEELVAAILKDLGYSVQLTAHGVDGGVDIIASQKNGVGEILLLVDCKRYAPKRKVGVEIVRALFGIGERERATISMLATTSHFTTPAREFQRTLRHRLALKDYDDLVRWISEYGTHAPSLRPATSA